MKPLAAVAFAALTLVVISAALAQRGSGSRGSFSERSAPSFHSSFAPSLRSFSGPAYRYSGPSFATAPRIASAQRFAVAPSATRPAFYSLRRPTATDRRRYVSGIGVPFAYSDYGWIEPGYTDSSYIDPGYTEPSYATNAPYGNTSAQPIYSDPGIQQQPAASPVAVAPRYALRQQTAPPEEEAVTLVFKDGRPSEQIHNYVLTRTMLYIRDHHRRDIPVDQLDLDATQKANQSNGVEFALPASN